MMRMMQDGVEDMVVDGVVDLWLVLLSLFVCLEDLLMLYVVVVVEEDMVVNDDADDAGWC